MGFTAPGARPGAAVVGGPGGVAGGVLTPLLSLQDAMLKTSGPRASALGRELGLWSTLSEPARRVPTPVLLITTPSWQPHDLHDSSSLQPCTRH